MPKVLPRIAVVAAAAALLHAPARAQLPESLPWGLTGAQVAAQLESRELRVHLTRAGRDVHAASLNRHTQAVAILRNDSLVGLIYFHPENPQHNAPDLFSLASSQAQTRHGPPLCRKTDLAVWTVPQGILEVRLRRPSGDGASGAEIRYIGPGYAEEVARRAAPRPAPARRPAPTPARGRSGPRLLGTSVDSAQVTPPPAQPEPAAPVAAAPIAPLNPTAEYCTSAS